MFRNLVQVCSLAGALLVASFAHAADRPPNVVLLLIDDLGWTDLGCQGSKFYETPHIDRLAAGGMRLTRGYSACTVCSPTRAAVMTGKYPARLHITDWIAGHQRPHARLKVPDWTKHLPHDEPTIAEAFRAGGYATAHIGKWHLGDELYWPKTHGFDQNIGGNHKGQPPSYFFPYDGKGVTLPGLSTGEEGEYLTDRLTDEAVKFVTANQHRPFFLYLPHYTVHTPLEAKPDLVAKYRAKAQPEEPQNNAVYAAMIESLDDGIGKLLAALDALQLRDETIVVFTSDNGGLMSSTSNAPLRVGKGSAYEGGVRVPLIVSYPPAIPAGSTSDVPAMSIDLFPTLAELCGLPVGGKQAGWDGVSLAAALKQSGRPARDALYWHYPHYHPGGATPYGAVVAGDYRLVEFYEDGQVELYNLRSDIGESNDLAASLPSKRDELLAMLQTWRKQVGAQMPTPNPDYDAQQDQARPAGKGKGKKKK
ncbi:MAG: sulfatase [Pirellulaceae bacterium]